MTPDRALSALGLDRGAAWSDIRARHRALIRSVHPDRGGDGRRAAELNEALTVLSRATDEGGRPLPAAVTPVPGPPAPSLSDDADRMLRLDVAPAELLMRLAEAGHDVGEVVFVDPVAGLIEIVVGTGTAAAQLAVTVGEPADDGVPVAFTLEPLGAGEPPAIDIVVDALAAAVRERP